MYAMFNPGVLVRDSDQAEAPSLVWREAAEHDHADAMFKILGVLVEDSDPAEARRWWERASDHDHAGAMFNLGFLAQRQ